MFSLIKKKGIAVCFLLFNFFPFIFGQEGNILPASATTKFITLFMHGFLTNGTDDKAFDPVALFYGEGDYKTVSYFRGDSAEPSPYQQTDSSFNNFFYYHLTGGEGRGLPEFPDRPAANNPAFLDYAVNNSKDYKILSDIFMEEMGDFNSGSRYLPEAQRQPFLALGKCEWVYRNSSKLNRSLYSTDDYNILIHNLLINGPKFHELLISDDYLLGFKSDGSTLGLPNKLKVIENTNKYTPTQLREIANEFVTLARETPNQFRFVAHSMGGMYTMRFISEPESKYYTRDVGGFYQRNRDYSFKEYLEDIYGISAWPANNTLPAPKARYQTVLGYLKGQVVTAAGFLGWSERQREEFIYNVYFRPERQNGVDKVIIQDSPLNGVYGADDLGALAATLFTKEGAEAYKNNLIVTASFNILMSTYELLFAGVLNATPGMQWLGAELIDKACWALTFDGIIIIASCFIDFQEATAETQGSISFAGFALPDALRTALRDYNPDDPPLLWVDVQENSLLVQSYATAPVPEVCKYKQELLYSSIDIGNNEKKDFYVPIPDIQTSSPIEMHVFSVGGIPIIKNAGTINKIFPIIALGLIKYVVQWDMLETVLRLFEFPLNIGLGHMMGKDMNDNAHFIELLLPFFFNILNAEWEASTILVPESSSSGIDYGRILNPINANPNAHVYRMEVHSYGGTTLARMLLEKDPNAVVDREGIVFDDSQIKFEDKINTEYIMIHNVTPHLLKYPVQMMKKLTAEDIKSINICNLSIFDSAFLPAHYKTDEGEHLVVWDSEFNGKKMRLWYTLDILKSPNGPNEDFPDLDYMKFDYSQPLPADGSVFTRNFFNYTMFGAFNGVTPVTTAVQEGKGFNNLTFTRADQGTPDRGLYAAYTVTRGSAANPIVTEEPLANMVAANYVKVLPVNLINYYPGLDCSFAINGSPFILAVLFSSLTGFTDLDAYAAYRQQNEDSAPSFVYTQDGRGMLVSPHFKEGYNNIVFRFIDPFGTPYYKDIQLLQMTVPPFIQPQSPLINSYVGDAAATGSFRALDISGGALKPADWFKDADFIITVDGAAAAIVNKNNSTYTVEFALPVLADGNHTIGVITRVYGMESNYGWSFWKDSTAPEIQFPPEQRFSNRTQSNSGNVLAYIRDTVPFTSGSLQQEVDTVYLPEVEFTLETTGGAALASLLKKTNTTLGAHGTGFNGWVDNQPLAHGRYAVQVKATDRTGNSSTGQTTMVIDNRAPLFRTLDINTRLVNLDTDLLSLTYQLELDEWETGARVKFEIINLDTNEKFELSARARGGVEESYTLTYFTEGVNVFKDGTYCIRVMAEDELGNVSTPVEFNPVVVDRTRPEVIDCYASPFFQARGAQSITLDFTPDETKDTAANKSAVLQTTVSLLDLDGNTMEETLFSGTLVPAQAFAEQAFNTLAIPGDLADAKYFLQVELTDKHGNSVQETVPFVIEAVGPEIIYPAAYSLIDGITLLKGSVIDPRFNNDLPLHHYELYYRVGEWPRPQFPSSLAGWASAFIHTPAWQQETSWPLFWGQFPVEGSGVLGYLDTTQLPEGLITVLVVARETDGYSTGSVRTFRISRLSGEDTSVVILPDPALADRVNSFAFTDENTQLSAGYTIDHAVNNPVDLSLFVQDQTTGNIIRQWQYADLKSSSILDAPVINGSDKGIFVWKDGTDGRFYLAFKNDAQAAARFFALLSTSTTILEPVDGSGNALASGYSLFEDNHKLLINRSLAAGEQFTLGISLQNEAALDLTAFIDNTTPDVYIGKERFLEQKSLLTLYPGSAYPPVQWDGRDEWGRYVENGLYTIGMEAAGNLGGYDFKALTFQVSTPLQASIENISNRTFNPGMPGMEQCTVKVYSAKAASFSIQVVDDQSRLLNTLAAEPQELEHNGYVTFRWTGATLHNQLAPAGIYRFLVTVTPLDGSSPVVLTAKNIKLDTTLAVNPAVRAQLLPFAEAQDFNGKQIISGDTRYRVRITPEGAYLPDKNLSVTVEAADGTQMAEAYPDLNYVAAFRTNYKELWAKAAVENADLTLGYNNLFSDKVTTSTTRPVNITAENRVVTYNIDTNSITGNNLYLSSSDTIYFSVNKTEQKPGAWFASDFQGVSTASIAAQYGKVINGSNYLDGSFLALIVFVSWDYVDWLGDLFSNQFRIKCTITAFGYFNYKNTYTVEKYLADADAFKIIGPDITSNPAGTLVKTPYVYKGSPLVFDDFIDDVNTGTGISADNPTLVWRKSPQYYFYYLGENYPELPQAGSARTSYNNLFTGYQNQGSTIQQAYTSATAVERIHLTDAFTSGTYPQAGGESKVRFKLDKELVVLYVIPIFNITVYKDTYHLTVSTEAEDRILLPYPERTARAAFNAAHTVGGDPQSPVPFTGINGNRESGANGAITPNFHVALTTADNAVNVWFPEDPRPGLEINTVLDYAFDASGRNSGYSGEINLAPLLTMEHPVLKTANISAWSVKEAVCPGLDLSALYSLNLNTTDLVADNRIILPGEINLPATEDTRWVLSDDQVIRNNTLESALTAPDYTSLNTKGKMQEIPVASLYPDALVAQGAKNLYTRDNENRITDNDAVLIHPGQAGSYHAEILGSDGLPYQGLVIDDVLYAGKGMKRSDAISIIKTTDPARKLAAVSGYAEGSFSISYLDKHNTWVPVEGSVKQEADGSFTAYWDVSGLNGLYTLRLVSEIPGTGINVDFRDVYIGELTDTTYEQVVLQSAAGEARIIFPQGSLETTQAISIDTVEMEDIRKEVVLPDIAPLGKIIRLQPEGLDFNSAGAEQLPQLQFTFPRLEMDGIDPLDLTIYHITSAGVLAPLPTIKLVYNDQDEILWDSRYDEAAGFPPDYAYLKAFSVLTHFSYYAIMEAKALESPVIRDYSYYNQAVSFSGTATPGRIIEVYASDSPLLDRSNTQPVAGIAEPVTQNGAFSITGIPLIYEGTNYIYAGYQDDRGIKPGRIAIIRDTTPPVLSINPYHPYLSPDGDGSQDQLTLSLSGDEEGIVLLALTDAAGSIRCETTAALVLNRETAFVLDGRDNDGRLLPEGEYTIVLTAVDTHQNSSVYNNALFIDYTPPVCAAAVTPALISPANQDGIQDGVLFECTFNEPVMLNGWICTQSGQEQKKIIAYTEADSSLVVAWDGKNSQNRFAADNTYYLKLEALDQAGNRTLYTGAPLVVDNTAPVFNLAFKDNSLVVVPALHNLPFTVNEPAAVEFSVQTTGGETVYTSQAVFETGAHNIVWNAELEEGNYQLIFTVRDASGNTRNIVRYIEATQDNIPPELTIPPDLTVEATGVFTPVEAGEAIAVDQSLPITIENDARVSYPLGINIVQWSARDRYGNTVNAQQKITVVDTTAPELIAPLDITMEATDMLTPVNLGTPYASDLFDFTVSHNAPEAFPVGITLVTWMALDENGNNTTRQQHVEITDTTAPVLTPPADIICEAAGIRTAVATGTAQAQDIFDVAVGNDAPPDYPLGVTLVTWTATDANGNMTTAVQKITIVDTTPPALTVPDDLLLESTTIYIPVNIGQAVTDDIYPVTVTHNAPEIFPPGTTTVTWTAVDANGNKTAKTQQVRIYKIVLTASKDTYISKEHPNSNTGAGLLLKSGADSHNRPLVAFDIAGLPTNALTRATVQLTVKNNYRGYGWLQKTPGLHRLLTDWAEGNGQDSRSYWKKSPGTIPGATWMTPVDPKPANNKPDSTILWFGGKFALESAPAIHHNKGRDNTMLWEVTRDVRSGTAYGWIVKTDVHHSGAAGIIDYYSREGAAAAQRNEWAPCLILEFN